MASITDCVVEGLKYPFNDFKKLLSFGVLFTLINLISLAISTKFIDVARAYAKLDASGKTISSISQLPGNDVYMIIGLAIISFILVLFINGYEWNIVKFSIDKREDLPGFNDIGKMFVNGVKYLIVTIVYNIVPVVFLILGMGFINDAIGSVLVIISLLLFIVSYFLLIMGLNNMIAHDDIRKAFNLKEITDNISNLGVGKYIGTILFTFIVYIIIMAAISFILSFAIVFIAVAINQAIILSAILAIIEGLFVLPYMGIFFNRVFGSIYRESIK